MAKYIDGGPWEDLTVSPDKIIVVDTETTGLNADVDELLQVSIVDGAGKCLLDTYVKPLNHESWEEAQAINGITPEMVADSPAFSEVKGQVEKLIRSAELLVGYNLSFDLSFLRKGGVTTRRGTKEFDVMKEFAPVHGEWNDWKHDWKWAKLTECAAHYNIDYPNAHNSLADAQVTLQCFRAMLGDNNPGGYRQIYGSNLSGGSAGVPVSTTTYSQKKDSKAFVVLVVLAVVFVLGGIGGAGALAVIIGIGCGIAAFFVKKKQGDSSL